MVKGTSRQVIVVHGPEEKIFEQAIFILKEGTTDITDEQLLKEAQQAIRAPSREARNRKLYLYGPVWASLGAAFTGLIWLISTVL